MKPVEQTRGFKDDQERGNCYAACIASVFELPLSAVPRADNLTSVSRWLARRYPGVMARRREYMKPHAVYPFEWVPDWRSDPPTDIWGYWIATRESPRFQTTCTRCDGSGEILIYLKNDHDLPKEHRETKIDACVQCGGTGKFAGLHAVVMRNREMVWDPSPKRDMGVGDFLGETVFVVADPSLLSRQRDIRGAV